MNVGMLPWFLQKPFEVKTKNGAGWNGWKDGDGF